jgi:hypothetical protein
MLLEFPDGLFVIHLHTLDAIAFSSNVIYLAIDSEVGVRFPELADFLRSSGSGTGATQPHEYGATWKKK